jgi:hypothetical protein
MHNFAAPGMGTTSYSVTLVASNTEPTCAVPFSARVDIPGCGASCPSISGELNVTPGDCTDTTHRRMNLEAMISGGGVADFEWDFGDGMPAEHSGGPRISHIYPAPGSYTTTLIVRGPVGCSESRSSRMVEVSSCPTTTPPPPTTTPASSSCLCAALLFFALTFEAAAVILGIVAVLTSNYFIGLFGLGALITALILLIIWMAICRDCPTLRLVIMVVSGLLLLFSGFGAFLLYTLGPAAPPTQAVGLAALTLFIFLGAAVIGNQQLGCPPLMGP